MQRFKVTVFHGEGATVYQVVDTAQPEAEQPCIVKSWSLPSEPKARFLAEDFCKRHNKGE